MATAVCFVRRVVVVEVMVVVWTHQNRTRKSKVGDGGTAGKRKGSARCTTAKRQRRPCIPNKSGATLRHPGWGSSGPTVLEGFGGAGGAGGGPGHLPGLLGQVRVRVRVRVSQHEGGYGFGRCRKEQDWAKALLPKTVR